MHEMRIQSLILANLQEHLKASGVPWTALLTSCFMENFVTRRVYQRQPDGARTWSDNLGSKPILAHAVADIGGSAAGAALLLLLLKGSWVLRELPCTAFSMHRLRHQTCAKDR